MKKRFISLGLVLVMSLSMLMGCGSSDSSETEGASEEKVFSMAISEMPETVNPVENTDTVLTVAQAMFEKLFVTDANGEVTYYLAESFEPSEDKMTYTLKLRDNATWSDGTDITADDVLFTVDYYQNEAQMGLTTLQSGYTCEKVDDKTVNFKLDAPVGSFGTDAGHIFLYPAHVFENDVTKIAGSEYLSSEKMVTSSAYTVAEWNAGESFVLKARDDYYNGRPAIDTLNLILMQDENSKQLAFDNGELSCITISSKEDLEKYSTDDYDVYNFSAGKVVHLQYNAIGQKGAGLTAEERRAIELSIDRQEIVDTVYGSDEIAFPSYSMFASTQAYFDGDYKAEQNVEEAKKLAEANGLTEKTITIIYNTTNPTAEATGVVVQQQLAAIGVNAAVQGYDPAAFYSRVFALAINPESEEAKDWDYAIGFDSGMYGDASVNQLTYAAMGLLGEQTSGAFMQAYGTVDEAEKETLFKNVQAMEEGYWIPIVEENKIVVSQKNVTGYDKVQLVPVFANYSFFEVE